MESVAHIKSRKQLLNPQPCFEPDKHYSFDHQFNYKNMGEQLMDILEHGKIKTLFQPIISLKDAKILGYEALSRGPKDTGLEKPCNLFDIARIHGKLWEIELLCRLKALESISQQNNKVNIFLNVDPDIINDDKFKKGFTKDFLKQYNINPNNIVFEITEKSAVKDIKSFKRTIDNYKDQGYKIAIDDTGSGYSGLKLITDVHPQYIKIDMNLIHNIDKDGLKHALIKTFYDFCQVTGIELIAEGIETIDELNTLIDMGIEYGQGYLIQRPLSEIMPVDCEVTNKISERNYKKRNLYNRRPSKIIVGDFSRSCITIEASYTGSAALDIFNDNPSTLGIPVVENKKLSGLLMKDKFFARLGTQYGFALFLNRPVTLIMDKRPLDVDYETTIDIVSRMAMTRSDENLYDYIIITKDSEYYGIVTVKDLLEKTTELEVNYAKHLNPLSGLPGNILIESRLMEYVKGEQPFTVLYIDLDNFKVYNDIYGFEKGDKILVFVSKILNECIYKLTNSNYFIGHIGGDDFVVIIESYDVEELCQSIISTFKEGINNFYSAEDLRNNYVISRNRKGEEEKYGIMTISIAGVTNRYRKYNDVYEISEYAGRIKKKCKQVWDSCFFIDTI